MSGEKAATFDRDALHEYNDDLGGILVISDSGDNIVVAFTDDMEERTKDDAHCILEAMGFE
jgi:hypothetical protein